MNAEPRLVTAVIPAYNAERYIDDAIDSVLEQTYPALECVVVDDGSTDETRARIARYGSDVRCIHQENSGVSVARNRGAAAARGDFLAFLDADDVWLPDRIKRMREALQRDSSAAILCAARIVDADLNELGTLRVDPIPTVESMLLQEGGVVSCSSNLLITRERFERLGGFDARFSVSADWDLLLRLVETGSVGYVDEALVLYRRHGATMSHDTRGMARDMATAYAGAFERKPGLHRIRRKALGALNWMLAGSFFESGEVQLASGHLGRALVHRPTLAARVPARAASRATSRLLRASRRSGPVSPADSDVPRPGTATGYVRKVPEVVKWRLNGVLSRLGERYDADWLRYSPIQMHIFHQLARRDAPAVIASLRTVFPRVRKIADVGAGTGTFAAEARRQDLDVQACERSSAGRLYGRLQGVSVRRFDLTDPVPARLEDGIELAYCFEVAEHLPPALGERLVEFLCAIAPVVVFTAAHPGQGGVGHINEQPPAYWLSRFATQGFEHRPDATAALIAEFSDRDVEAPWFRDNTLVLARIS